MSRASEQVGRLYAAALRKHLTGGGEEALHQAYQVGRTALAMRLGVVDLMLVHQAALAKVLAEPAAADVQPVMAAATVFLIECLSPFEMMLRGYQDSNARLSASNAELTAANAALASAHEALKAEIAERERAEAALVHAQKLQAVGLLAGGVAHHFNNLLTVVLGNLQLARRRLTGEEEIARFLAAATSGAERGAEVVRQLLTFSRQQVLEAQVISVGPWLASVRALLANALRGDITIEVDESGSLRPIRVDPSQLELALLNLAVNARDAMPAGGVLRLSADERRVTDARLGLDGDYVVISIADTGEGIDPEIALRVFEPFFTTKSLGPGAGLGLSQVHGFVHQSGGAVDLESVVGSGTTVRIYLPVVSDAVTQPQAAPIAAQAPDGSGCVLVVDDDVEVAQLAGELLEGCGYEVKLVHRAKAALDLLGAGEPVDLLFSDIVMPGGMNGVQLASEVRRRYPRLPILLGTGYSDDTLPEAAAMALPVITKPYDANGLCWRVGELMRGRVA